MFHRIRNFLNSIISKIFGKKRDLKIGLYGPVNAGKTTLANRICMDWLGEELGTASAIPHETREIQMKEKVTMQHNGKSITFNLVDTPGIATKIDFEDFLKFGMKSKEAKQRATEATKGVIEAIKWLDNMDLVLIVMDATEDPLNQVNITLLGNLDARKIPVLIVANKMDLRKANLSKIRDAFPNYELMGISAKDGRHIKDLYARIFKMI